MSVSHRKGMGVHHRQGTECRPPKMHERGAADMSEFRNRDFLTRVGFALHGLGHSLRTQASLRFQAIAGAAALLALVMLRPSAVWWALVLLASTIVLAAELFNTAIEELADALHPEHNPGLRIAKDCAAAGVLLAALGALGVAVAFALHLMSRATT
jgi:diacylglycerol kinase (ATP)